MTTSKNKRILYASIFTAVFLVAMIISTVARNDFAIGSFIGRIFGVVMMYFMAYYFFTALEKPKEKLSKITYAPWVRTYFITIASLAGILFFIGIILFFLNKSVLVVGIALILTYVQGLFNTLIYLKYNKRASPVGISFLLVSFLLIILFLFLPVDGLREIILPIKLIFMILIILFLFFTFFFGYYVLIKHMMPWMIDYGWERKLKKIKKK